MKDAFTKMVKEFSRMWRHYLLQSVLAFFTTFTVLLFLRLEHTIIIASMGSSPFIVFAMAKNVTSRPKNVIGGHIIGLFSGFLANLMPFNPSHGTLFSYSLAVALSIFIMVATNTEHPPASGTALSVAISRFTLHVGISVITAAVILSLAHLLLKPNLKSLVSSRNNRKNPNGEERISSQKGVPRRIRRIS